VADSAAMQEVHSAVQQAVEGNAPVLLEGEQGVGKEFVARLIHHRSLRRDRAFETLLPPALPAAQAARELFGEQARKLRQAAGGTLLLKEVWRFPATVQQRIVEAVQRGAESAAHSDHTPIEVHDVWVMMSSRVALEDASRSGLMAPGLATRPISGNGRLRRIVIPPLRRRGADIPALVEGLAREHAQELDREPLKCTPKAMDRLAAYAWPGNVSELKSVVYRLFGVLGSGPVREHHLDGLVPTVEDEIPLGRFGLEDLVRAKLRTFLGRIRGYHVEDLHSQVMSQVERPLLELVLEQTDGNQLQAARILGMNRNTLRKRIRSLGIRLP
jgi:two-component system nitrogen regulation response regulator GlnG